ncbi:MAG: hypothetical protein DRI99_00855 [Candidatus Aminicenantes bacterium]|nr:MAG: hypothetical protein DRI99_00855 [Candidatus Aminicenantes bacterium]
MNLIENRSLGFNPLKFLFSIFIFNKKKLLDSQFSFEPDNKIWILEAIFWGVKIASKGLFWSGKWV